MLQLSAETPPHDRIPPGLRSVRRPVRAAEAPATTSLRLRRLLLLPLAAALLLALAAQAKARSAPESFADLAEKLLPSVVNIASTQKVQDGIPDEELDEFFKDFFDRQQREGAPRRATSLGSGFIIDSSGYIVTNNHVIAEADEITIRLHDDREFKATLVGRDDKTDLALLKVEADVNLPAVSWGDSDATRIGDWVLAIGNPFGLGGSVTAGIVSARQRDINAGPYDDFLQTDASINRGNSGGPMFNMDGEVIGINTAIFSPSGGSVGIGFAIPSQLARHVVEQLREFGHARRGWLGVRIQTVTDDLVEGLRLESSKGALVANVTPGGPAEQAGIQQGDVIVEFDGKPIVEMRRLPRVVAETPVDKEVDVVIWRQGREMTIRVRVGELDETEMAAVESREAMPGTGAEGPIETLGLSVAELTPELRERFQLGDEAAGVVVTEVQPEGTAGEKGMRPGDVIVEVDQQTVTTPDEVVARVEEAKANNYRVVTLLVYREGDYQWVALRIDQG
ncbi:MAG: serine protease [Alphaproteobacteria bacterium]|nr:MAG: serine protease [Alphaproteobacteria bacterium]